MNLYALEDCHTRSGRTSIGWYDFVQIIDRRSYVLGDSQIDKVAFNSEKTSLQKPSQLTIGCQEAICKVKFLFIAISEICFGIF